MSESIERRTRTTIAAALIGTAILFSLTAQTSVSLAAEKNAGPAMKENTAYTEQEAAHKYEKVIAHGGGAYRGYETTNSVEALNNAIANGYKIIELDMELSSDHKIVMLHDWDRTATHYFGASFPNKLSQSQFIRLSVHGKFEVLTFDKLEKILEKSPDVRIVTDIKDDSLELLTVIAEKYPDFADRFIPQIYDCGQWSRVKELGYRDVIFTLYAMAVPDPEKIASFVKDHEIYAVTMPDYVAEKGVCRQLSDQGIIVYVHPVSRYEDALQFMKQGAYGVYSGSLLPEEFTGIEEDYYLTASDPDGPAAKLTDSRIEDWKELKLHGQKPKDTVLYYIDESPRCAADSDFTDLTPGKHKLTVRILNQKKIIGTLDYYLWKDTDKLRVLHKKYEYRLDAVKPERDFYTVMQDESVPKEVREILSRSLIAKAGEYTFYFNGNQESYMNGDELLTVQKGSYGKLLLPLSATVQRLGATSVTMNGQKDITIVYNGEQSMIMAGSSIVRKGFRLTRLKSPVVLYLNKAMAGGEFYQAVTERPYVEKEGIIIILPGDAKSDIKEKERLIEAAKGLY